MHANATLLFLLTAVILTSCSSAAPTPVLSPTHAAAAPTVAPSTATSTALPVIPTYTFTAAPLPRPILPTEPSTSIPGGITYYHFVNLNQYSPPAGSVVILPDSLVLAPSQLDTTYGTDVTTDLRRALEAVLKDERNLWSGDQLQIAELSYKDGHVNIVLEGEYYAVAHVVLAAARAQILMTLFANAAVQSATVTVNGGTIANISISNSMDARPADYTYTRAEIEDFMAENAYTTP